MKRVLAVSAWFVVLTIWAGSQSAEAAVPIINSLSPNTKVAGSGSFVMTVTGSNFTTGSVVRWNGTAVSTGYVSPTQLSATVGSSQVASTGTPSITVYTSGRKGGTSNTLSFTITAPTVTTPPPPPPPLPAPTPLSITTTSLPGGTANASFSCTVAATGGTPAYGWSLVNGGGSLPPGLALSATGTVSGTPTLSGAFTFTTQANDSASQIAQKVLSITVAVDPNATTPPPPTSSTILFQENFESGTFSSKWAKTNIWSSLNPAISGVRPHSGNYAYEQYYNVCGDSTNTACLGVTQDVNRYIYAIFDPTHNAPTEGLTHFFVRAYLYFKSPEPGGVPNLMRKLIWINDSANAWSTLLKVDGDTTGTSMSWTYGSNGSTPCGMSQINAFTKVGSISYNTWYSVEEEIKLNTPGLADGIVRLWVNGSLVAEHTSFVHRGSCTSNVNMVSFGRQAQRFNYNPINEYRYYDDIVISTGYVGP